MSLEIAHVIFILTNYSYNPKCVSVYNNPQGLMNRKKRHNKSYKLFLLLLFILILLFCYRLYFFFSLILYKIFLFSLIDTECIPLLNRSSFSFTFLVLLSIYLFRRTYAETNLNGTELTSSKFVFAKQRKK